MNNLNDSDVHKLPLTNRVISFFLAGSASIFGLVSIVVAVLAVLEIPILYGQLLITAFPYEYSFFDLSKAIQRLALGFIPAPIIMVFCVIIQTYLLEGKQNARKAFLGAVKGFFYQITHPFSDPRSDINKTK